MTAAPGGEPVRVHRREAHVGEATLSYLLAGPDDGPTVLMLHGIPASAELWRDVAIRVAGEGYRVLAPDLLGYGTSDRPPDGDNALGLAASADVVARWLRQVGTDAWVCGHDLGGGSAQILAVRQPDLVRGLTLGDCVTADTWPVRPIRLFRAIARTRLYGPMCAAGLMPNPYASWELRRGFADFSRITAEDIRRVFWDDKVHDPGGRARFAEHLRSLDSRETRAIADRVGDLEMPCQLIWGEQDRFQSWDDVGARLQGLLPDTLIDETVVPDAGHFLPLERPDAYADALLEVMRA